ncbi:MAG TPA: sulfite exporter TauE/SafE family protein [Chitinophagales bacterium]|nr:sulfite exporter TauE/SafE family protein [Chitinophagales bacterium]
MEIAHIFGYIGALCTGLVLGLMGGGGGLLAIPILVYLFGVEASVATGYSLFLVALTASSGAFQNIRKKMVDYHAAFYYGLPSVITLYIMRRYVMPAIPKALFTVGNYTVQKNQLILFALAIVMFAAAYKMITSDNDVITDEPHKANKLKLATLAVVIGSFLGLVGAGGGFLVMPSLIYFANLPPKKAVGTALVIVSVNSLIGFIGDLGTHTAFNWSFLLTFSFFSISGVFIGHYLAGFIHNHLLKKYFGWFILVVGIWIVIKEAFLS